MAKKDTYYFSHDCNAKDDPKIVMLMEQLGPEGYGIYWILVETLREQPSYRYPVMLLPALARRFNTTAEKVKAVVANYKLFIIDEDEFFSESLNRRMGIMNAKIQQRKDAANSRWGNQIEEKPTYQIEDQTNQEPPEDQSNDFGLIDGLTLTEYYTKQIKKPTPDDLQQIGQAESECGRAAVIQAIQEAKKVNIDRAGWIVNQAKRISKN